MNSSAPQPLVFHARPGRDIAARLAKVVAGDVLSDAASRGALRDRRVDLPGRAARRAGPDDATTTCARRWMSARELQRADRSPRGAGSSQCGQTVGAALVIDHSKHLIA